MDLYMRLTMICVYSVPMKVKGTVRVKGKVAASSPVGPLKSFAPLPNGNNPEKPACILCQATYFKHL